MGKPRYSETAEADILAIWVGLAIYSAPAADRAVDRFRAACRLLAHFPHLGRAHPEIASDARVHVVERWLVLYRADEREVTIRRIVDGRRDRSRLRDDDSDGG